MSIPSLIIPVLYLAGARRIFRAEQKARSVAGVTESRRYEGISYRAVSLRFVLAAIAVISTGIWLSFIGDEISRTTGWGASFVGTLLLAITTSMPELVVAISALRLGALDMAIGDVLGANMLDIMAVTWIDLAYTKGPILAAVIGLPSYHGRFDDNHESPGHRWDSLSSTTKTLCCYQLVRICVSRALSGRCLCLVYLWPQTGLSDSLKTFVISSFRMII